MRLWFVVACMAAALSGCQHFSNLTPDDFARGTASRTQFGRDNYDCQIDAGIEQNRRGGGDVHGTYNDAYVACMAKRGYHTTSVDMLGFGG